MSQEDIETISDGYHTFRELYDHRRALTALLFTIRRESSWKSKNHHPDDDPMFDNYFIVGMNIPFKGHISYHYKLKYWDDFSHVPEIPHALKWDGHTSEMVVTKLLEWANL